MKKLLMVPAVLLLSASTLTASPVDDSQRRSLASSVSQFSLIDRIMQELDQNLAAEGSSVIPYKIKKVRQVPGSSQIAIIPRLSSEGIGVEIHYSDSSLNDLDSFIAELLETFSIMNKGDSHYYLENLHNYNLGGRASYLNRMYIIKSSTEFQGNGISKLPSLMADKKTK